MYKIKIHNAETGEIIERDMTDEEIAERQTQEAASLAQLEAENAAKAKKAELLEKLGITEDEAKLLLS